MHTIAFELEIEMQRPSAKLVQRIVALAGTSFSSGDQFVKAARVRLDGVEIARVTVLLELRSPLESLARGGRKISHTAS